MSKKIYIFRHGETDWNKERRFQGNTDIPLNDTGREQAKELTKKLADVNIEACVSSDLIRAYETAQIALEPFLQLKKFEIATSAALREQSGGAVEGMHIDEIIRTYGQESAEAWLVNQERFLDFAFPEAESNRQHRDRILLFLHDWLEKIPAQNIAISTHGGALRRILWTCDNNSQRGRIHNCALFKLSWNKGKLRYEEEL